VFYCRSFKCFSFIPIWIICNFCRGPLTTSVPKRFPPLDPGLISVDAVPFSGDGHTEMTPWNNLIISYGSEYNYVCWRDNNDGAWYIQALTQVLEEYYFSKHLIEILDEVKNRVERREFEGEGQRPTYSNGLRERIYFQERRQ